MPRTCRRCAAARPSESCGEWWPALFLWRRSTSERRASTVPRPAPKPAAAGECSGSIINAIDLETKPRMTHFRRSSPASRSCPQTTEPGEGSAYEYGNVGVVAGSEIVTGCVADGVHRRTNAPDERDHEQCPGYTNRKSPIANRKYLMSASRLRRPILADRAQDDSIIVPGAFPGSRRRQ